MALELSESTRVLVLEAPQDPAAARSVLRSSLLIEPTPCRAPSLSPVEISTVSKGALS
jgi:hypothetical protein